jgi:hypothetical protein
MKTIVLNQNQVLTLSRLQGRMDFAIGLMNEVMKLYVDKCNQEQANFDDFMKELFGDDLPEEYDFNLDIHAMKLSVREK